MSHARTHPSHNTRNTQHHFWHDAYRVILHLCLSLVLFTTVTVLYARTLRAWSKRYGLRRHDPAHGAHRRHHKSLWRLMVILCVFIATWALVIGTDVAMIVKAARQGGKASISYIGDVPSTAMVLVDAIVLGNVLVSVTLFACEWLSPESRRARYARRRWKDGGLHLLPI